MSARLPQWIQDALIENLTGNTTNQATLTPAKPVSRAPQNPHLYNRFRRAVDRCSSIAMNEELLGYTESANAYHLMAAEIAELSAWAAQQGAGPVAAEKATAPVISAIDLAIDGAFRFGEQDRGRIEGTLD